MKCLYNGVSSRGHGGTSDDWEWACVTTRTGYGGKSNLDVLGSIRSQTEACCGGGYDLQDGYRGRRRFPFCRRLRGRLGPSRGVSRGVETPPGRRVACACFDLREKVCGSARGSVRASGRVRPALEALADARLMMRGRYASRSDWAQERRCVAGRARKLENPWLRSGRHSLGVMRKDFEAECFT